MFPVSVLEADRDTGSKVRSLQFFLIEGFPRQRREDGEEGRSFMARASLPPCMHARLEGLVCARESLEPIPGTGCT